MTPVRRAKSLLKSDLYLKGTLPQKKFRSTSIQVALMIRGWERGLFLEVYGY